MNFVRPIVAAHSAASMAVPVGYRGPVLALIWLAVLRACGLMLDDAPLWLAASIALVAMAPATAFLAYDAAVSRIDFLLKVRGGSWLRWVASGSLLRIPLAIVFAALTGIGLLMNVVAAGGLPFWIAVLCEFVLLWAIRAFAYRAAVDVVPWFRQTLMARAAITLSGIAAASIFAYLTRLFDSGPDFPTLAQAIAAQPAYAGPSELTRLVHLAHGFSNGALDWALGQIDLTDGRAWVWLSFIVVSHLALFFGIACSLSAFLLPAAEYRRVLLVDASDAPPPLAWRRIAIAAFAVLVFVGFAAPRVLAKAENWLSDQRASNRATALQHAVVILVDGRPMLVAPAVATLIEEQILAYRGMLAAQRGEVRTAARAIFKQQRKNVDSYLDWYFSPAAEVLRVASLVSDSARDTVATAATSRMSSGVGSALEIELGTLEGMHVGARALEDSLGALAEANALDVTANENLVVDRTISLTTLFQGVALPPGFDFEAAMKARLGTAVAAAVGGGIATSTAAKAGSTAAARVLVRAVAAKAGGAAAGAAAGTATGAVAGSVVPVAGTAVGAVTGAIVGSVVGLVADYSMLKWSERRNRPAMRKALIEKIDMAERLALESLHAPPAPPGVKR